MANAGHDFDFQIGAWRVSHRRLNARLCGCADWTSFEGTSEMRLVLGGHGNVEDNLIHFPTGSARAVALRSFEPTNETWAIWWLDARAPHRLDTPVVGGFADGVGRFFADDFHEGNPVRLRFLWLDVATPAPRWEQALSADGGATWETNWTMDFRRA